VPRCRPRPTRARARRRRRRSPFTALRRRHGHSKANAIDVIVSDPVTGELPEWGLSELGEEQADAAGAALRARLGVASAAALVRASPFSRTRETAARAAAALGAAAHVELEPALRERFFGAAEGGAATAYESVWAADAADAAARPPGGGESVADVAARLRAFVARTEAAHAGRDVIVVSHGDALSILAAALRGAPLGGHRKYGLANCGVLRVPANGGDEDAGAAAAI
jgi:broad specificity phosphatase PhoE